METIKPIETDDVAASAAPVSAPVPAVAAPVLTAAQARQALPPKGACWYCDRSLDSVRRFCGKGCADAFDEESGFIR